MRFVQNKDVLTKNNTSIAFKIGGKFEWVGKYSITVGEVLGDVGAEKSSKVDSAIEFLKDELADEIKEAAKSERHF